jgi:hypothetical protein
MSERTPAVTKQAVARLVNDARGCGESINELVTSLATQHGVARSTIFRWAGGQHVEPRGRVALEREHLVVIARHQGNRRAAYEDLERSGLDISYRQFCRRFDAVDTDFQIAVTEGIQAMIRAGLYNVQDGQYERGDVFGFDHTEVPVWVLDPGDDNPRKIWISVAVDWATGFIFTPTFTEGDERLKGDPNTTSIVALVAGVMLGQDLGDVRVGGIPSLWVFDNAATHFAEEVRQGFMHLGTSAHAIRPGSPWENGPTENAINVIERGIWRRLPGYTNHLSTRYGKPLWKDEELLSADELIAITVAEIERINREAEVKRLEGRTRLQAWCDANGLLEFAEHEHVSHVFTRPHKGKRKVSKNGVHFKNIPYSSPKLAGHIGRTVEIRHLKTDASFIDVYLDGELLCRATPAQNLTRAQRSVIARQRRSRQASAERIQKASKQRAVEMADAEHADAILRGDVAPEEETVTWNGLEVVPELKTMFDLVEGRFGALDLDDLDEPDGEGGCDADR